MKSNIVQVDTNDNLITRFVDGNRRWDELHYYPNAIGDRGVIFLDGLVGDSYTEFDGKWFHASPEGDAAIKQLLASLGVEATPKAMLPSAGATPATSWLIALACACLVAGSVGGYARRST